MEKIPDGQDPGFSSIEAATRLMDSEDHILIRMEMPGIREETIKVQLEKNILSVTAHNDDVHFCTDITLPCEATISRKKYGDEVLELVLSK